MHTTYASTFTFIKNNILLSNENLYSVNFAPLSFHERFISNWYCLYMKKWFTSVYCTYNKWNTHSQSISWMLVIKGGCSRRRAHQTVIARHHVPQVNCHLCAKSYSYFYMCKKEKLMNQSPLRTAAWYCHIFSWWEFCPCHRQIQSVQLAWV